MKAQVEVLLSRWGRWAIRCQSGALGFPSSSPMFKDAPKDGYGPSVPLGITEDDVAAVDAAVMRLETGLRIVVIEVYQRGGSIRQVASRLGFSPQSVGKYLDKAHEKISVDIQVQWEQNSRQSDSVHRCV